MVECNRCFCYNFVIKPCDYGRDRSGEVHSGESGLPVFDPTFGRILIDGVDARERSQLRLHSNIGYVLQTPHLFSGSVLENLRYGNPQATMEQIEATVKSVSAEDVIARMDKGYESEEGEGRNLPSTGEKQLLSFFVLDETSPKTFNETPTPQQQIQP